jgi:hypothetical protein
MRWAGHVASMTRRGLRIDHFEDLNAGWRLILRWILEKQDAVVWTEFNWHRILTNGGLL